jgi:hypothetical protein
MCQAKASRKVGTKSTANGRRLRREQHIWLLNFKGRRVNREGYYTRICVLRQGSKWACGYLVWVIAMHCESGAKEVYAAEDYEAQTTRTARAGSPK